MGKGIPNKKNFLLVLYLSVAEQAKTFRVLVDIHRVSSPGCINILASQFEVLGCNPAETVIKSDRTDGVMHTKFIDMVKSQQRLTGEEGKQNRDEYNDEQVKFSLHFKTRYR